jgi:hypothetical protein
MSNERRIYGEMSQGGHPVWEPLERAAGMELADGFMWMYEIDTTDGGHIQAYKHIDTRRYLHLDGEGRAYEYIAEQRYREIPLADALDLALCTWQRLGASEDELALVDAAIERARAGGGES